MRENSHFWGFELGADISVALDLDEYYVYHRNPQKISLFFSEVLVAHLNSELPTDYMQSRYQLNSGAELLLKLFSDTASFDELVRSSEGVLRDFLKLFSQSFAEANRKDRPKIDRACVIEAARNWFEIDKKRNLDDQLRSILQRIVNEVVGAHRVRHFLLPRGLEKNKWVKMLFDQRVIHLMVRGYVDSENAGEAYDIYTIDYGAYVQLLDTARRPDISFRQIDGKPTPEWVVPFDDQRALKRIVLTEESLVAK
jgi:hypothetical protein